MAANARHSSTALRPQAVHPAAEGAGLAQGGGDGRGPIDGGKNESAFTIRTLRLSRLERTTLLCRIASPALQARLAGAADSSLQLYNSALCWRGRVSGRAEL